MRASLYDGESAKQPRERRACERHAPAGTQTPAQGGLGWCRAPHRRFEAVGSWHDTPICKLRGEGAPKNAAPVCGVGGTQRAAGTTGADALS